MAELRKSGFECCYFDLQGEGASVPRESTAFRARIATNATKAQSDTIIHRVNGVTSRAAATAFTNPFVGGWQPVSSELYIVNGHVMTTDQFDDTRDMDTELKHRLKEDSGSAALINAMVGLGTSNPGVKRLKKLKVRQMAAQIVAANVGAVPPKVGEANEEACRLSRQLLEKNWHLSLGVNLGDDEYQLDVDEATPEEVAALGKKVALHLKLSIPALKQLAKDQGGARAMVMEFENTISAFEDVDFSMTTEDCVDEFNWASKQLYDWADMYEIWVGGEGPPQELKDVHNELKNKLDEP